MRDTEHFKASEFKCPCCGITYIEQAFVDMLEMARRVADTPFRINSGCRCRKHNREVGGKEDSAHIFDDGLRSCAADIQATDSATRFKILYSLMLVGFTRFGIADSFIHVDGSKFKPQRVVWLYQ